MKTGCRRGDPSKSHGRRRGETCRDRQADRPRIVAGSDDAYDVDVGRALRRLREARGLSIRALAEKSGLAVNTLSLIENGKSSPSVSTLQLLARGLDVPVGEFFACDETKREVVHLAGHTRPRSTFEHGALEDLAAGLANPTFNPFVVTLGPRADSGPASIVHTGDELVFCLGGRIACYVDEAAYVLEPGDSLIFAAHLPHRWRNLDDAPARALLVLCPADARDEVTARHFALAGIRRAAPNGDRDHSHP